MEASYVFSVNRELFDENCDPSPRYLVNQGGTSSGKTYCIMQRMVELAVQNYRSIITVAGQDLPNLKVGAMRDTEAIITGDPWLSAFFTRNHSESFYRGLNGSLIEFKSYKDAQDAKNGKRDYLFVNEANGLTWDVFWQLAIRTRRQIWVDYNPSARFWVHDQLIGRPDCKLIISDHRGNGFLSEAEHAKIESIKDPHLFAVYARGLTGRVTGLVLQNWDIVDELPPAEECKIKPLFGLDFGYTNDPTALEEIRLAHGEIWVDEYIYQTGLVNVDPSHRDPNIVDIMRQRCITRDRLIVADSAEEKSIREISNEGFWIIPATKGAGSVRNGIDIMRRYKIHFTRRSVGAIEEAKKWKWAVDRDGNVTNEAIDRYNHAMDAIRYASQEKLGARHTGTARARINKL